MLKGIDGIQTQTGYVLVEEDGTKKPITLTKARGGDYTSRRKTNSEWVSEDKKVKAAALYYATGDFKVVSDLTGHTEKLLRTWSTEPWFMMVGERVKKDKNLLIDAKISSVIEEALGLLEDRLKNGDYHITKHGEVIRKPIDTKSIIYTISQLFDRRQLIRGEATSIKETVDTGSKLKQIFTEFEQFAKFLKAKEVEGEVVEVNERSDLRVHDLDVSEEVRQPEEDTTMSP